MVEVSGHVKNSLRHELRRARGADLICSDFDISLRIILLKPGSAYHFSNSRKIINHLLFRDDSKLRSKIQRNLESLVQTVQIFSDDICMDFPVHKCPVLVLKRVGEY